jgi:hypothetical protein
VKNPSVCNFSLETVPHQQVPHKFGKKCFISLGMTISIFEAHAYNVVMVWEELTNLLGTPLYSTYISSKYDVYLGNNVHHSEWFFSDWYLYLNLVGPV